MANEIKDITVTKTAADIQDTDWFEGQTAAGGTGSSFKIAKSELVPDAASAISFTPAGNISSTDVQAAIEELDALIAPLTYTTTSTAGGTITLDMASLIQRMFRGTASFATPKTLALSNATNALVFGLLVEITDVAAVLTVPADWYMNDINYDGTAWTPPEIGRYELGGTLYGTEWMVKIQGPFS